MVIYIIGPSGAGKSYLVEQLAKIDKNLMHVNLDKMVKEEAAARNIDIKIRTEEDWEKRWEICLAVLDKHAQKAKTDTKCYLIDVGAGDLQTTSGRDFFKNRSSNLICIWASPEVVYERKHKNCRKLNELRLLEYNPERMSIYLASRAIINNSIDTLAKSSLNLLEKIIGELIYS